MSTKPSTLDIVVHAPFRKVIKFDLICMGIGAALAWSEAIKAIFKEIFGEAESIGPLLIYAIVVTIAAVILTIIVARAVSNAKKMGGLSCAIIKCPS